MSCTPRAHHKPEIIANPATWCSFVDEQRYLNNPYDQVGWPKYGDFSIGHLELKVSLPLFFFSPPSKQNDQRGDFEQARSNWMLIAEIGACCSPCELLVAARVHGLGFKV